MSNEDQIKGSDRAEGSESGGRYHLSPFQLQPLAPGWQTPPTRYRSFPGETGSDFQDLRIDYRRYLGILIKHRWLILGIATLCTLLGFLYTLAQTPVYRATATIQIKREVTNFGVPGLQAVEAGQGLEFYETQFELLKSRGLAEEVVTALGLSSDSDFIDSSISSWSRVLKRLSQVLNRFSSTQSANEEHLLADKNRAVSLVLAGVNVEPLGASSIVAVSFDSVVPALARRIANALAENFISTNLQRSLDASAHARGFLKGRLEELKLKLEESERKLVEYAEAEDIMTTGENQTLLMTNLTSANTAMSAASVERRIHEVLWQQAQSSEEVALPQLLENSAIGNLRSQRVELVTNYEDGLRRFKPDFPDMVHLQARITEVDRQIEAEATFIKESLRSRYEAAVQQEEALMAQVEHLKAEVMDAQNRSIQFNILGREVETNRTLYDGLLQRYKEIGVTGGIDAGNLVSNASIIDPAELPTTPHRPILLLNVGLGLVLGSLIGGAAAFAREQFDDTYKTPEDVEEALGLPVLGVIPQAYHEIDDKVSPDGQSAVAEAFRSLRTALQFSTESGVPKSLLVTSSCSGEGKSTTAAMIARNFASLGKRVFLIDADLRRPSLYQHIDVSPGGGLTDYLADPTQLPSAVQVAPNLTLLPCGPIPSNPTELLASPAMAVLLQVSCKKFDLVVVDAPPVAGLADAPLLASMTAATLLVVQANTTRRGAALTALKRLRFARARMLGVVLNRFDARRTGYGSFYAEEYGFQESSDRISLMPPGAKDTRRWLSFHKRAA